jgi:hypothetical protein
MHFAAFLARVEACTVFILSSVAVCCCAFFELVFYENQNEGVFGVMGGLPSN